MVKLLTLDDDGNPAIQAFAPPTARFGCINLDDNSKHLTEAPTDTHGFFRITAYYPIISQIATGLDLTSLDQLSQTCRQVRGNLLQYRAALIARSLRCRNEVDGVDQRSRSLCARDMVSSCQRCADIYCRNCIVKPKSMFLASRHRRLCKTCIKSPVDSHTSCSDTHSASIDVRPLAHSTGTSPGACTCAELMWFCAHCEKYLQSEDISYMRGWSWRRRYSHTGIGIGEGEQGVPCGREGGCLAVREVEVEIDADQIEPPANTQSDSHRGWTNTSYIMQEIEGIGGVVKKKVKKRVPIGAVVKEYEDERVNGAYLHREQTGRVRSWCAHCTKIIPSEKDRSVDAHSALQRVTTSSSGSSTSST